MWLLIVFFLRSSVCIYVKHMYEVRRLKLTIHKIFTDRLLSKYSVSASILARYSTCAAWISCVFQVFNENLHKKRHRAWAGYFCRTWSPLFCYPITYWLILSKVLVRYWPTVDEPATISAAVILVSIQSTDMSAIAQLDLDHMSAEKKFWMPWGNLMPIARDWQWSKCPARGWALLVINMWKRIGFKDFTCISRSVVIPGSI